jgi:hypothetical protein
MPKNTAKRDHSGKFINAPTDFTILATPSTAISSPAALTEPEAATGPKQVSIAKILKSGRRPLTLQSTFVTRITARSPISHDDAHDCLARYMKESVKAAYLHPDCELTIDGVDFGPGGNMGKEMFMYLRVGEKLSGDPALITAEDLRMVEEIAAHNEDILTGSGAKSKALKEEKIWGNVPSTTMAGIDVPAGWVPPGGDVDDVTVGRDGKVIEAKRIRIEESVPPVSRGLAGEVAKQSNPDSGAQESEEPSEESEESSEDDAVVDEAARIPPTNGVSKSTTTGSWNYVPRM